MLQLPAFENLVKSSPQSHSCQVCSPFSFLQDPQNTATPDMFAGVMNMLLSTQSNESVLQNSDALDAMTGRLNSATRNMGKLLPLSSGQSGNVLPVDSLLRFTPDPQLQSLEELMLSQAGTEIPLSTDDAGDFFELFQAATSKPPLSDAQLKFLAQLDRGGQVNSLGGNEPLHLPQQTGNHLNYWDLPANALASKESTLMVDIHKPGWERMLGERVFWVVSQGIQGARLQLNPPELGPLKIDLTIDGDQVNVNFVTQNIQAKEAIDLSMSKLREMFQSTSIQLADTQVFNHNSQQGKADQPFLTELDAGRLNHNDCHDDLSIGEHALRHEGIGLIDTYA